jgi:hypothetical protein
VVGSIVETFRLKGFELPVVLAQLSLELYKPVALLVGLGLVSTTSIRSA